MSADGLTPIGARVLIEPLAPPTVTESGIELIEDYHPETMGRVVACGAILPPIPPDAVKVGDIVVFSWQAGQELFYDQARLLMLHQDDILAVVEQE
jgi:co-chaperonin GroES (HSP10)